MDVDGANQTQITNEPGYLHLTPSWSPDGKRIVFSRCDLPFGFLSSCDIAVINADGSHLRTVVGGHLIHSRPQFSPDGKRIVFQSDRAGAVSSVWVVNSDGSHLRRVTKANTLASGPTGRPTVRGSSSPTTAAGPTATSGASIPTGRARGASPTPRPATTRASVRTPQAGETSCSSTTTRTVTSAATTSSFGTATEASRRCLQGLEGLVVPSWGPAPSSGDRAARRGARHAGRGGPAGREHGAGDRRRSRWRRRH